MKATIQQVKVLREVKEDRFSIEELTAVEGSILLHALAFLRDQRGYPGTHELHAKLVEGWKTI